MNILGVRFDDQDGSITVEWYESSEQKREGGVIYQSIINQEAVEGYEHVGYYAAELREDVAELVSWFEKYRTGVYED